MIIDADAHVNEIVLDWTWLNTERPGWLSGTKSAVHLEVNWRAFREATAP